MGFLLHHFLKSYSDHGEDSQHHLELERNIADIAHKAEDIIDNLVAEENVFPGSSDRESYFESFLRVQVDMKFFIEKDLEIQVPSRSVQRRRLSPYQKLHEYSLPDASKRPIVGLEIQQNHIFERLTTGQSSLEVIPIIGMTGIGKTTLAQSIYGSKCVSNHFEIRIWITMFQECTVRDVLLQIFICKDTQYHSSSLLSASHLGEILYKYLFIWRYLIVLDDIWSWEIWNGIRIFFPDSGTMSRIIVTSRLSNVETYFGFAGIQMSFLDRVKSWELLCETIFGTEGCPNELENVGKVIACNCKGLPLSILLIGKLLKKSRSNKECWEDVARDMASFSNLEAEEGYRKILLLCYKSLPEHLRRCLLLMLHFPERDGIYVFRLIGHWVAQDFVESYDNNKSLKEVGREYLEDLVERNLIMMVYESGLTRKMTKCYLRDSTRDMLKVCSRREKLFEESLHSARLP
ncbi:late blight resistance protein R1-A-like isoform X2 [Andrographis paniculata]|nr:late blight resistance protein R1-A-like isoform X2 [Andrographis paniculata]